MYLDKQTGVICAVGILSAFIIGIIIGNFAIGKSSSDSPEDRFENKQFVSDVMNQVDSQSLRSFLEVLTKKPHIAASDRDRYLTNWIRDQWTEFGLDSISLSTYDLLFSYPNPDNPNKIYLYDADNKVQFTSRHKEDVLRPEDEDENFVHAFNGYSPAGDVSGELVYVNYGRVEDIQKLETLGVSLEGKIAISRYGKIFRGNRVRLCQDAGAIGVIMFSDPADVTFDGLSPGDVYPNSIFLPDSGMQRGHARLTKGDPLSPTWPSVKGAYRQAVNETEGLPKIPSQPIGYGDAKKLLEVMGGSDVPEEWRGKIPGIGYKLGPGFSEGYKGWRVRLVVNNFLEDKEDSNVMGVIRGEVEPDRYVLLSNHRDAWGYGAVDPSSGTCALMEIARVLGSLAKTGWRPRRSIVFASWGAEEYGLMGSTEWVYDKIHKIMNRAVALINIDICVSGDILSPSASPILKEVFIEAIKSVPSTYDPSQTYYEFLENYIKDDIINKVEDKIKITGSGSDHAPFSFYAGIPALYLSLKIDKHKYPGLGGYPTYHTGYETFYLVDQFIDPGFKLHRTCSKLSLHMLLNLGESAFLPLTPRHIVVEMQNEIDSMIEKNVPQILKDNGAGPAFDLMLESIRDFNVSASSWIDMREAMKKEEEVVQPLRLRSLNDQIMLLERTFLLPGGLPGRAHHRHALFSPAKFNSYGGAAFPGISDLLHEVEKLDTGERRERFKEIRKHLSDLMIVLRQAASWLSTETQI